MKFLLLITILLNNLQYDDVIEKITGAVVTEIHPLKMVAFAADGKKYQKLAINEVSLLRETHQSVNVEVNIRFGVI